MISLHFQCEKTGILNTSRAAKVQKGRRTHIINRFENSRFYITTGAAKMLHDLDNQYWKIGEWSMVKQQRALLRLAKKQKTYGTKLSLEDLENDQVCSNIPGLNEETVNQIDKNLELKNLVKIKVMSSGDLLEAYNIPFYEPRIIYEDQIDIKDNRIIYDVDLVEYKQKDPIFIQKQKLNSILQERQNLINELQVLQNG